MKKESGKKNKIIILLLIAIIIGIVLITIIIGRVLITKYYSGTWIRYGENIPPRDATIWNSAISYRITVTKKQEPFKVIMTKST